MHFNVLIQMWNVVLNNVSKIQVHAAAIEIWSVQTYLVFPLWYTWPMDSYSKNSCRNLTNLKNITRITTTWSNRIPIINRQITFNVCIDKMTIYFLYAHFFVSLQNNYPINLLTSNLYLTIYSKRLFIWFAFLLLKFSVFFTRSSDLAWKSRSSDLAWKSIYWKRKLAIFSTYLLPSNMNDL